MAGRTAANARWNLFASSTNCGSGFRLSVGEYIRPLIKDIRSRFGALPILVLSMHDESMYAERVLRAGAQGYVMKQEPGTKLLSAIRQVLDGRICVSDAFAERALRKIAGAPSGPDGFGVDQLSDRELEVFRMTGQGLRPRAIANQLCLSVRTVESYFARIKQKMGFSSASELAQQAVEWAKTQDS